MATLFEVKHISVSIDRSPGEVYAFISDGANLAKWAAGLGGTITRDGDQWIAEGPLGKVRVRMAPQNQFGVVDHTVTLPTGATVHNPLRVIANGTGSTVTFTLLRLEGVSDQRFNEDAAAVTKDLATLKALLEKR
jgi:hypothetical protein